MTHRERQALDFIRAYQAEHGGVSPTLAEIAAGLGTTSRSNAFYLLDRLERQGRIQRGGANRSIRIVPQEIDLDAVDTEALIAALERRLPLGSARFAFDPVHARSYSQEARA